MPVAERKTRLVFLKSASLYYAGRTIEVHREREILSIFLDFDVTQIEKKVFFGGLQLEDFDVGHVNLMGGNEILNHEEQIASLY